MRKYLSVKKGRGISWLLACACMFTMLSGGPVFAQEQSSAQGPLDADSGKALALLDAGVDEADAERLRTKQEVEDREDVIEVEFFYMDNEYEYTIRCEDGMILEWQVEGRGIDDAQTELSLQKEDQTEDASKSGTGGQSVVTADGTALIGIEQAKKAVQDEAGSEDLEFKKIHFELDGRYYEYEFEFFAGNREYECTVDAQTGDVIHMEMDD